MKGQAILVGLNSVSHDHYKPSVYTIREAEKNVKQFYNKLMHLPSMDIRESDQLLGSNATLKNLKNKIDEKKRQSNDEDTFLLIYFSGHGYHLKGSGYQFYCLYDQMILDNEFLHLLNEFDSNFKILVILDTCYAGGLKRHEKAMEQAFKHIIYPNDKRKYRRRIMKYKNEPEHYDCSLAYYFSAGGKERSRHQGRFLTPFTKQFIDACFDSKFDGNFYHLEEKLVDNDSLKISECFDVLGGQTYFFRNTIPFKINTNSNPNYQHKMSWTIDVDYHNNDSEKVTATISHSNPDKKFTFLDPVYEERAELPSEILDKYPDINHGMRVTYSEGTTGTNTFKITLSNSQLSYILPHNNDEDSVVYIENNTTRKRKSKPVKGDVENGGGLGDTK